MDIEDIPYQPETETKIYETLKNSDNDLSIKEIAEKTELHRHTVRTYIKVLYHTGRIIQSRKVGNATFYDTK